MFEELKKEIKLSISSKVVVSSIVRENLVLSINLKFIPSLTDLLAIIAAAYAIYHGPERLKNIASNINYNARYLKKSLQEIGLKIY